MIPLDCVREIFRHVYDAADIARFSCVSKAWHEISHEPERVHIHLQTPEHAKHISQWLSTRVTTLRHLRISGNCQIWSIHWRYHSVVCMSPRLTTLILIHDGPGDSFILPSIEDVAPVCPQLERMCISSFIPLHVGSCVSRYCIQEMCLNAPLLSADWMAFANGALRHLSLIGNVTLHETMTCLSFPPLEYLQIPSSVVWYCQELLTVDHLHLRHDGDFEVDVLVAPKLKTLVLQGGEWDTTWVPPSVDKIIVRCATVTPGPHFTIDMGYPDITLHQKK